MQPGWQKNALTCYDPKPAGVLRASLPPLLPGPVKLPCRPQHWPSRPARHPNAEIDRIRWEPASLLRCSLTIRRRRSSESSIANVIDESRGLFSEIHFNLPVQPLHREESPVHTAPQSTPRATKLRNPHPPTRESPPHGSPG